MPETNVPETNVPETNAIRTDEPYDVAVVGYGPVGAAAANLLGAAGLRTLVLERATTVVDIPRAIHFDAGIMRVFQSVGLADEIAEQSRVIASMETYGARGQLLSTSTSGSGVHGWAEHYTFYQPRLEKTLRAGAARYDTVDVELGVTVTGLDPRPDAVSVSWARPDAAGTARARYVIGADGAASTVRKLVGVRLEDLDFDEPWLVVDATLHGDHGLPEDTSRMLCDPRRPTTIVPGPGDHRRWEFMLLPGEDPAEMSTPARIDALLSAHVDPRSVTLLRASVYRFHALVARDWRRDRVLLAGDAAHQTPPFLGQGMCHGIRDVQSLAWRLRAILRGKADGSLLDSYAEERAPQVREVIERAVTKGREICVLDPVAAAARDFAVAERSAWAKSLDSTMMLAVTAGLVHPGRPAAGPLPQPWVVPHGAPHGAPPIRLDDALSPEFCVVTDDPGLAGLQPPPGCALPVVTVTHHPDPSQGALHDPSGAVHAWLAGARARAAIVRPDRHPYGFAGTAEDLSRLLADLRDTFEGARLVEEAG